MTIAARIDQGGVPAKSPIKATGSMRRTIHGIADRAERSETVTVAELPVWCIEA